MINSQKITEEKTELDNWLYTAQFVRFSIEKIIKGEMFYPFPIEDGLFLTGNVWKSEYKSFGPGTINAQNKNDLSFYSSEIDDNGHFILPVDNYSEGTSFLLNAKNAKNKTVDCSFTLTKEIYPNLKISHPIFRKTRLHTDIILGDTSIQYSIDENQQRIYHIDNITVQSHKQPSIDEASRNSNNFIGEDILIKQPGSNVRSLLNRFTAITIIKNSTGSGAGALGILEQQLKFNQSQTRENTVREYGETTISWKSGKNASLAGGTTPLNIVINGELIFGNIDHILEWTAGHIKSIELIKPTDSRCVIYGTSNGAIAIETLSELRTSDIDIPKGQTIYPFGLTTTDRKPNTQLRAPSQPGHYRLLIDVVTKNKEIVSFCREFEVKK